MAGGILFLVRVSDNSVIASDFTHQPYSNLQIAASIPTTGDYVFEIASFDPPTTSPATYTFDFDCYAGGIAELSPYKPGGWSSSVVLSTVQGSRTDSASLASRTPIYLSLAITNDGALPVLDTFSVDIQLDGQTVKHLIGGSLIPGWFYTWEDISLGTLPDGDHSFAVVIDSGGLIPEGNEQDNIITRTLRVGAGGRVSCSPNSKTLCLEQGRFAVTARWQKPDSTSGDGTAVSLTGDSGYFWFFAPANIEIVTKVLFACTVNSSHWVFAGGLTNVGVTLTVRDTVTGAVKTYINPVNTAFEPLQDTGAFPCP